MIFLCKQTPNESFKLSTVLIPVPPDAPSQDFIANNAVTNHISLMPHTCLAPLVQPSIQLNSWHVYFCYDTRPDAFQLQSHIKTITEKNNPSFSHKTQLRDREKEGCIKTLINSQAEKIQKISIALKERRQEDEQKCTRREIEREWKAGRI